MRHCYPHQCTNTDNRKPPGAYVCPFPQPMPHSSAFFTRKPPRRCVSSTSLVLSWTHCSQVGSHHSSQTALIPVPRSQSHVVKAENHLSDLIHLLLRGIWHSWSLPASWNTLCPWVWDLPPAFHLLIGHSFPGCSSSPWPPIFPKTQSRYSVPMWPHPVSGLQIPSVYMLTISMFRSPYWTSPLNSGQVPLPAYWTPLPGCLMGLSDVTAPNLNFQIITPHLPQNLPLLQCLWDF